MPAINIQEFNQKLHNEIGSNPGAILTMTGKHPPASPTQDTNPVSINPYNSSHHDRQIQFAMTDRFEIMAADYCDSIERDSIGLELMAEIREGTFAIWCVARSLANDYDRGYQCDVCGRITLRTHHLVAAGGTDTIACDDCAGYDAEAYGEE